MATHRTETMLGADSVAVMDCVRVVETGRPEELMRTPDSRLRGLLNAAQTEDRK